MNNKNTTVLILGGLGLVGQTLAQELNIKSNVIVIDRRDPKKEISRVTYKKFDIFDMTNLRTLFSDLKPNIVINAVNIATICSDSPEENFQKIIKFYCQLYHSLCMTNSEIFYIQIGTTGSGGLGFDIPFTHGGNLEDMPIIKKAAFAGISTAMLTLISRTNNNNITIAEIKPGLAIFKNQIDNSNYNGSNLVTINGGESGDYTYNELALLTSFMGFALVEKISEKVIEVLENKKNWHRHCVSNTIESLNKSILNQTRGDVRDLKKILKKMKKLSSTNYIIATGNLGPPSITRDLILSYLKIKKNITEENFTQALDSSSAIKNTLDYIKQNKEDLHQFLQTELNFLNFTKITGKFNEPWENVKESLNTSV